jgi:hypothetical protein
MPSTRITRRSGFLRHTLCGTLGALVLASAAAQAPPASAPRLEFVYEAVVDIDKVIALGQSPYRERRMVPITGGSFEGPGLRGKVVAGGADRQLVRRDGALALDAVYELKTDDGIVISVRNRVLIRPNRDGQPGRYAFSTVDVVAPDGAYGWLNDFVYVGTLTSLLPGRSAVAIRVYRVL